MKLGLKCGGTPADRASRLWSTKGKTLRSQLDPKVVAPALLKKDKGEGEGTEAESSTCASTHSTTHGHMHPHMATGGA